MASFLAKFGIKPSLILHKNIKKDNSYKLKKKIRKRIETAFSVITSKFGKVIKAISIDGFLVTTKTVSSLL